MSRSSMGVQNPAPTSAEQDVHSKYWRRQYCYLQRAGVVSRIKRQTRRRDRQAAKDRIKRDA